MRIKILLITLLFVGISLACNSSETPALKPLPISQIPLTPPKVYTFSSVPVWSDEFDTPGLPDSKIWSYDVGGSGWGNNELQY